jgi:hypothetical protein
MTRDANYMNRHPNRFSIIKKAPTAIKAVPDNHLITGTIRATAPSDRGEQPKN